MRKNIHRRVDEKPARTTVKKNREDLLPDESPYFNWLTGDNTAEKPARTIVKTNRENLLPNESPYLHWLTGENTAYIEELAFHKKGLWPMTPLQKFRL